MNKELVRIRLAAALVLCGLLTEGLTLRWSHPTAFFVYSGVGTLLLGIGVLLFLSSLLSGGSTHTVSATENNAIPAKSDDDKSA